MNFARTMAAVSVTGTALGLALAPVASAPASAATTATKAITAAKAATATKSVGAIKAAASTKIAAVTKIAAATEAATATAGTAATKAAVPVSATGPAGAGTLPTATTPAAEEKRPVVVTCDKARVTEPKTYMLACGDGNEVLAGLSWSRWSPGRAIARGMDWINNCEPDCARGTYHSYPVYVAFGGSADVYGHPGEVRYARYRFIYPGQRPPGIPDPRIGQLPA
jgi:hypothetical protein